MTAFLWAMICLFACNCLTNAYYLGSGRTPESISPGVRTVALLLEGAFLVWALKLLGAL